MCTRSTLTCLPSVSYVRRVRRDGSVGSTCARGLTSLRRRSWSNLQTKERATCRNEKLDEARESPRASSKSRDIGSSTRKTATITPIAGMTPQLEKSAAELLERQT